MLTGRVFLNIIIATSAFILLVYLGVRVFNSRTAAIEAQTAVTRERSREASITNLNGEKSLIRSDQLKKILDSNRVPVRVVDIQERADFRKAHIPTAINIPSDELEVRAEDELAKSDFLVLVSNPCDGSNQQSLLRRAGLINRGFKNVEVLAGGLPSWTGAGFSLAVEQK